VITSSDDVDAPAAMMRRRRYKTATKRYLCGLEQGQQKWIVVDVVDVVAVVAAKMLAAVAGSVAVALLLQGIGKKNHRNVSTSESPNIEMLIKTWLREN
jgi:hypothetical protein